MVFNFSMQILEGNPISIPILSGKARVTRLCDNIVTMLWTDLNVTFVAERSKCFMFLHRSTKHWICSSFTSFQERSILRTFGVKCVHMYVIDCWVKPASLMSMSLSSVHLSIIFLMDSKRNFDSFKQRTFNRTSWS